MILQRTIRTGQPLVEPVTLDDAKAQLRVDTNDENALIESLIIAARERVESFTNRYFSQCTISQIWDRFPVGSDSFFLGLPDLVSIQSIKYLSENAEITMAGGDYVVDVGRGEIRPTTDWPVGYSIKIDLTVGNPAADCPVAIKQAILLFVSDFFEVRANLNPMQIYDNRTAIFLAQPYRVLMGI